MENALTGFVVLLGITAASFSFGMVAVLSTMIGTAAGRLGRVERALVNQGLFGYNAVLTGIGIFVFLQGSNRWWIALIGAFLSTVVTAAMMQWLAKLKIPVLTFPFAVLTWLILLVSYRFEAVKIGPTLSPAALSAVTINRNETPDMISGWIHGIGQVYIMDHLWAGILILVGVFLAGWKQGLLALGGSIVGWSTAYFLRADMSWLNTGLYGYNAALTFLAIGGVFGHGNKTALIAGAVGAAFSVPMTAGISVFLAPYGLPAFTMPFILTTWLYLGSRQFLRNW